MMNRCLICGVLTTLCVLTESRSASADDAELLAAVRRQIAGGRLTEALEVLDETERVQGASAETKLLRGECLLARFRRDCPYWELSSAGPASSIASLENPLAWQRLAVNARQYRMRALEQEHPDLLAAYRSFLAASRQLPESPSVLRGLATTSFYRADKQQVLRFLRPLMGENCNDVELLFFRGVTLISLGELRSGIDDLSRVIQLQPNHLQARRSLGTVVVDISQIQSQVAWLINHPELADGTRADAHLYGLDLLDIYSTWDLIKSSQSKARGDLGILETVNRIRDRFPDSWEAWHLQATICETTERTRECEEAVSRAIELAPQGLNIFMLYELRGRVRQRMGNSSAALGDHATAIRLEPLAAICYEGYNRALRNLDRLDEIPPVASKIQRLVTLYGFHRKLDVQPDDGELWTEYAGHLLDMQEIEWSLTAFRRAAELRPAAPQPVVGIARVLLQTGKANEAVEACNRAIQLSAGREAVSLRGDAWLQLKKPQQALDDFQAALRLDDAVADAWIMLAQQHLKSGDRKAATAAASKAVEFAPDRRAEVARLLGEGATSRN